MVVVLERLNEIQKSPVTLIPSSRPQHEQAYANWEEHVYLDWLNKYNINR